MPILPPALDDLDFERLYADLKARIPAHTPEWTAPQDGDPGVTILQLFAWLGDNILYRANLIPERQRLAFLRLLGMQMRPALPARGLVQLNFDNPAQRASAAYPRLTRIDQPVPFETLTEIDVMPVQAMGFIKRRPSDAENGRLAGLMPDLQALFSAGSGVAGYVTTPVFAGGKADEAGLDLAEQTVDGMLWLALLAADPDPDTKTAAIDALGGGADNRPAVINLGLVPQLSVPQFGDAIGLREPIPVSWDICTGGGNGDQYVPLDQVGDSSAGLTHTGVQRLMLPGKDDIGAPTNDIAAEYRAGVGARPPRIDDPLIAARIVSWLRLKPDSGTASGRLVLSWAGINCVEIEQRRSFGRQTIGRGTGASGQGYALGATAIDPASVEVAVEEDRGLVPYRQIADIAAANAGERVFSLDTEAGTLAFGDGVHGRAPEAGRAVQVLRYRAGGGAAGNLPAGTITRMTAPAGLPQVKLLQPLALTGGADAETIVQAEQRIPAAIRHCDRAVTVDDIRQLAGATPGLNVGRVEVLERFRPHSREFGVPGTVSVMLLPASARMRAPAPRPDRPMLEMLHRWLDERRPLATELYAIAPEYRPLGVTAAIELVDQDRREELLQAATSLLHRVFWPLAPGGLLGTGWGLGETLDSRAVEAALIRLPGIRAVAPLRLFARAANGQWSALAGDSAGRTLMTLERWQLPELLSVGVSIGNSAATSLPVMSDPNASGTGSAVPVPVVPEHC